MKVTHEFIPTMSPNAIYLWFSRLWHIVHYKYIEWLYRFIARTLVRMTYRCIFHGFEKIPVHGPALLIANHISYMDGLLINAACTRRKIHFIIDEYIYKMPVVNYFMTMDEAIPIAPNRDSVSAALDQISNILRQGGVVCIFPSGQLTYTGDLGHFKPGVEWIIQRDPVPVYPIAISGMWGSIFSRKYMRAKWRWVPRSLFRKVRVVMGDVLTEEQLTVREMQRVVMRLKHDSDSTGNNS